MKVTEEEIKKIEKDTRGQSTMKTGLFIDSYV